VPSSSASRFSSVRFSIIASLVQGDAGRVADDREVAWIDTVRPLSSA